MIYALLLACTTQNEDARILDREAYLGSLRADAQSIDACNGIQDPDLQGECVLFLASRSTLGFDACDTAYDRTWREACYFEVVDRRGLSGDSAKRMCLQTGEFQARCMYHILQREEQSLMTRFPAGQEEELMRHISEQIQNLSGAELQNDPLSHSLVARIIARRFRKRWQRESSHTFSATDCGSAPPTICQQAYRFAIKLEKRLPKPCRTAPRREELLSQQFPVWQDSFSDSAMGVWRELCFNQRSP
ncbi:MAG: hypothetical protein VX278_03305 [Myxococcota bacterium]|nr:hypothetical protein [Myxococcota bacterium]